MNRDVPETLVPDRDYEEASIDSLIEDVYASEDESARTTYTICN